MSGEYATGTIRATLAAAPRRPLVLAAKILVFGAVTVVVAELVAFASFFLGQALLTPPACAGRAVRPGVLRAVAGTGLFLCVVGLLALGIAVLVRHTARAISAYVASFSCCRSSSRRSLPRCSTRSSACSRWRSVLR